MRIFVLAHRIAARSGIDRHHDRVRRRRSGPARNAICREHRRESHYRRQKFTERPPQSPLRSPHGRLLLVHASFGQNYLTVDLKVARDSLCVTNRLSSAYRQLVFALRDDDAAGISNHTQIAALQVKLNTLTGTW
ncbi:MAG: hypothetical protein JWO52_7919 [Gammaproteobacteria bacterium]|nr:hypothetical protein [Gammaproteobacteria bacterium]